MIVRLVNFVLLCEVDSTHVLFWVRKINYMLACVLWHVECVLSCIRLIGFDLYVESVLTCRVVRIHVSFCKIEVDDVVFFFPRVYPISGRSVAFVCCNILLLLYIYGPLPLELIRVLALGIRFSCPRQHQSIQG